MLVKDKMRSDDPGMWFIHSLGKETDHGSGWSHYPALAATADDGETLNIFSHRELLDFVWKLPLAVSKFGTRVRHARNSICNADFLYNETQPQCSP